MVEMIFPSNQPFLWVQAEVTLCDLYWEVFNVGAATSQPSNHRIRPCWIMLLDWLFYLDADLVPLLNLSCHSRKAFLTTISMISSMSQSSRFLSSLSGLKIFSLALLTCVTKSECFSLIVTPAESLDEIFVSHLLSVETIVLLSCSFLSAFQREFEFCSK